MQTALAATGTASVAVEILGFGGLRGASPRARYERPFDAAEFAAERSAVAEVDFERVVETLLQDVRSAGRGRPVALVTHSLGGVPALAAVERAPELFSHLVLIAAMTPAAGLTPGAYNAEPEMADSLLPLNFAADPASVGALRCDFDGPAGRDLARRTFYEDVDARKAAQATGMLSSDCTASVDVAVEVTPARFGSVPRTWVLTSRDRAVPPAMQRRLIHELDSVHGATAVQELDSSHSPFLSRPAELAQILASVAA